MDKQSYKKKGKGKGRKSLTEKPKKGKSKSLTELPKKRINRSKNTLYGTPKKCKSLNVKSYVGNKRSKNMSRNKRQKLSNKKKHVKVIIAKRLFSEEHMKSKEGEYFDKKHYNTIVDYDCDCYYYDENNNEKILFKFRKNVLPEKLCKVALDNLKEAAKKTHDNRGASAGVIDLKKMPSYANQENQLVGKSKFRVLAYISKLTGKLVKNSLGNISRSNIIGFFDKRDRNLGPNAPNCRTTAFTSQQVEKWNNVLPFIKCIDKQFKKLIPVNHKIQYDQANQTEYVIKDTAFSTVTINYNWRTALHKDAGDLKDGFGNLIVCEEGRYEGGCTGFPQFKVAIDVRNGDFLAMDVHEWHCNTKIKPIDKDYTRLSLVAYLRDKMIRCK